MDDHEDYTSLKRSLSGISSAHADHAEHIKMKEVHTPHPEATEVAFAALQNLPMPLIVLNSSKTIMLANEAMGRLLGLRLDAALGRQESVAEVLEGQTLSQIGIDMLQDGVPVWISWEKFLDNLAIGLENEPRIDELKKLPSIPSTESAPAPELHNTFYLPVVPEIVSDHHAKPLKTTVHDTVVDVVVPYYHDSGEGSTGQLGQSRIQRPKSPLQTSAQMIISLWHGNEREQYFTLTFTTTILKTSSLSSSVRFAHSSMSTLQSSSPPSSANFSPSDISLTGASLLTNGALPRLRAETFIHLQKLTRMKDAMLSSMDIPVVGIWKDESAVFPNQAARKLFAVPADAASEQGYDFMSRFKAYTADFERELGEEENPMLTLCRTQKAFSNWKIGLVEPKSGKPRNFDVNGKPVVDERTGEFLVGLVAFKDVTEYTEKLATQNEENEQQFQLICDTMPQMLWTATPDGYHDYFSQRWYDYTALTQEQSLGMGWQLPFHPDDMPATTKKWAHFLATGDEYTTEYRCRRADGAWRWMLGRALPLRDVKTNAVQKWFGTCTDIQDLRSLEESYRETRERLLEVLKHSQMSVWQVDREAKVTFFEGGTTTASTTAEATMREFKSQIIGRSLYEGLGTYTKDTDLLRASVDRVLSGQSDVDIIETRTKDDNLRWFRSRNVAQRPHVGTAGIVGEDTVVGVVGISMDVTEMKKKEEENVKLLAAETAAKEASKMKSNFLANMSHEIRTPIAGIIGMSELIMDTALNEEQNDFAQNVQRSANTLLTVINDILDFSKIEPGRLDIEEVQFSLGVVLGDVSKMLSFAAEQKKLQFQSDIKLGEHGDLIFLGDPGRIRQILTNLLTNSIKFTAEGGNVTLSAHVLSQTSDTVLVEFVVGDNGIGITDDVKARLFKPFSQADSSTARRFGGTGLGLSICKNLVDLMRGKITLESNPGSGTIATFSILFNKPQFSGSSTPLVEFNAVPNRLQSELSPSYDTSSQGDNFVTRTTSPFHSPKHKLTLSTDANKVPIGVVSSVSHVLIVEDNAINQQIAIRTVRNLGYTASAVWNGQEALQYLLKATENAARPDTHKPTPTYTLPLLILIDVQMPVLDGCRATHTLRHHAPFQSMAISSIPVVAMTASAIQDDREKYERAGINDYLAKPVKRTTLEKMIHKWISNENRRDSCSASIKIEGRDTTRDLCRGSTTSTDHSCNYPGVEYQTAEPQINSNSSTPRRVSTVQSPLNSFGISQVKNASDRGLRLAQAAEMAASLRDAKLISTATETDDRGLVNPSSLLGSPAPPGAVGSHMYEAYPDQHGLSLELTQENVERFNADLADDSAGTVSKIPLIQGRQPQDTIPGAPKAPIEPVDATPLSATAWSLGSATAFTDSSTSMNPTNSRRRQLSTSDHKCSD